VSGLTLSDVLVFISGMSSVPPLGFEQQPVLKFRHLGDLCAADMFTAEFPLANTCTLELHLPIHTSYEIFRDRMSAAMSMVKTFTSY
jgi:hypothetical protein